MSLCYIVINIGLEVKFVYVLIITAKSSTDSAHYRYMVDLEFYLRQVIFQ